MNENRTRVRRFVLWGLPIMASAALGMAPAGLELPDAPRLVNASDIARLVSQNRGRVVLLNLWATWCPPCLGEFPEIVAVEREYRNRGLVVVSVSADSPDRVKEDLLPFLDEHRPGFEVLVRKNGDPEAFAHAVDREWNGTLPATFFFDRRGRPSVKRYSSMTRREIERIVEYLLQE